MDQLRKAREAFRLANDLMLDLVAGTSAYTILKAQLRRTRDVPDHVDTAVFRLCLFHTITTLSRWVELYDRYKDVIPPDVRPASKSLRAQVKTRGIVDFRNKVVGHIWDLEQHRALSNTEVQQRLNAITSSDYAGFFEWAGDPDAPSSAPSAAQVIERVRDSLRSVHSFTDGDLHQ